MIVTSVQIKTVKMQKHLYCPVFTKTPPENPVKSRVSGVFSFLRRNSKNEKITNFH